MGVNVSGPEAPWWSAYVLRIRMTGDDESVGNTRYHGFKNIGQVSPLHLYILHGK